MIFALSSGMVFIISLPNQKSSIKWTSYLATGYAEGFEGEESTIEEQVEAWAVLIKTGLCWSLQGWFGRNATSILDIGSGTGHFIQHLKEKGWKVEGIEMDKDAREYSINEFSLNVRDNNALFKEEFEQKDVISLWHVLEHLYNPQKYIERILELLKNDGLLVIALPNANSWDAKHYKKSWGAYDVPRHIWHFTPTSFRRLIADYPVEIIKTKKMPLDALYVSMLSEKYKGKSLASIRGIIKGVWSNIMCLGNAEKSSSVIYFLKKK